MSLADKLQQAWYQPQARLPWWTFPVASLYRVVVASRRALYRRGWLRSARLPVPVIVVGNITVGGAGKTPLVIALVEALRARGFKPGVVSRGYGGSVGSPRLLGANPDPAEVGDEPSLIGLHTGAAVAVGADRAAAAGLLLEHHVDAIVADDGLQHYALARDVEICVVDGVRRFGNGRLLPAGPLREPLARLSEVGFVVCNGGVAQAGEIAMHLELGAAVLIADMMCKKPLAAFAGTRVHAVAGIGHPQRFFDALRGLGIEVVEHPFLDHHRYSSRDLEFHDDATVLMTEKDAVKCRDFGLANMWAVPVSAELPDAFFDAVAKRIAASR